MGSHRAPPCRPLKTGPRPPPSPLGPSSHYTQPAQPCAVCFPQKRSPAGRTCRHRSPMTWKPAPMERISRGQISVAMTCQARQAEARGRRLEGAGAVGLEGEPSGAPGAQLLRRGQPRAGGSTRRRCRQASSRQAGPAHPGERADGNFEEHLKQAQHRRQPPGVAVCGAQGRGGDRERQGREAAFCGQARRRKQQQGYDHRHVRWKEGELKQGAQAAQAAQNKTRKTCR